MSNPFYECFPPLDSSVEVEVAAPFDLIGREVGILQSFPSDNIEIEITTPFEIFSKVGIADKPETTLFGDGVLSGITKVQGVPESRLVEVYDLDLMALLASTQSNSSGGWYIDGLPKNRMLRVIVVGEADERDVTLRIESG